ncbi:hypothetical protein BS47DRAFT_1392137 [Hydnum rufescens UP504]|uniref:AMP-dependent synthetase/ligase domain-containing protein n=1 Tax=Hydnum rufescens UP504 TaxID=1448309 RepID=A0A9P6AZG9_9AGAM|nr:hypothetical protein BS47DRAFT_1392137 [Hydnum rufescens UP504]
MAFDLASLLNYNSTTLFLASLVILLYTLRAYLQPIPLAHPLLLGRQSDIGKVRSKGETATYRNYGVGHGVPLPSRLRKDILVAHDVVQSDFLQERTLWSTHTTNEKLRIRIKALGNGLIKTVGLTPAKSSALLLLDDSFEWLLIDLTLSNFRIHSTTLTKLNLLSPILAHHIPDVIFTHVSLLEPVLEQVAEEGNHFPIVVVGENALTKAEASRNIGFNVVTLEEAESSGRLGENVSVEKSQPTDLFSTTFYDEHNEIPIGVQLTHQNLTAGPAAVRQFFTLTTPLSSSSTVLSAFPLSTPFGRAIAYYALFEGCNFATLNSTSLLNGSVSPSLDEIVRAASDTKRPRPTHLFIKPEHLEALSSAIISHAGSAFFGPWAWSRKLVNFRGVPSPTPHPGTRSVACRKPGERLLVTQPRIHGSKEWLSLVLHVESLAGPASEETFPTARLALSIPIVNAHIEAISTAPIFASHPFDLQHFPPLKPDEVAHVGPPGANVEVKLVAADHDAEVDETINDPVGTVRVSSLFYIRPSSVVGVVVVVDVFYRGPSIGEPIPLWPVDLLAGNGSIAVGLDWSIPMEHLRCYDFLNKKRRVPGKDQATKEKNAQLFSF